MADPDLDAVVADLREAGVHLGPGTQTWIDPEQLAAITATAREADVPLYLVLVEPPEQGGGIHHGDDLLVRVHDAGGPDGLYVGVNNVWRHLDDSATGYPRLPNGSGLNLAVRQWGEVDGSTDLTDDVELVLTAGNVQPDGVGTPYELGDGLLRVVESLAAGDFRETVTDAREGRTVALDRSREERSSTSADGRATPGDDGTGAAELVTLALLAVVLLVAGRRLLAAVRGRRTAPRTFALPDSVLERVRAAGDAELVRRARKDVLALGEAIDAAELRGSDSAAWAAALDHYEVAGRVLPADAAAGEVDPLDAVGAIVLAARGQEALAAAKRGKAFAPTTPCFLNPLHGRARGDRTLEHEGRTVKAPVCQACRRDLGAGRRPDILDVVVRGRPEHYFETDREPWASTGFGALEPDLVRRLRSRPGGRSR
ncbi:hypothetical protein [Nocardioides campestrisoli]|uniref:hypothetical protein n=1 Tax=Nocardioides campestrisoli TaxID=2736757 RepID=UPI0015E69F63|nr:hypothetical protein [Nocardioides campestrisoli]